MKGAKEVEKVPTIAERPIHGQCGEKETERERVDSDIKEKSFKYVYSNRKIEEAISATKNPKRNPQPMREFITVQPN